MLLYYADLNLNSSVARGQCVLSRRLNDISFLLLLFWCATENFGERTVCAVQKVERHFFLFVCLGTSIQMTN